jgi:serine/threonine-protein kinase RsbW
MLQSRQEPCRQEALDDRCRPVVWHQENIQSAEELRCVLDTVTATMVGLCYPTQDVFGVRLALEEALVNAIKHGHQGDATKPVRVRYHIAEDHVLAEVEDRGNGFDPHGVPDPLAPENLDRPCGRGLLLMRHYLTWLRYNERGNCVTLCKYRSLP